MDMRELLTRLNEIEAGSITEMDDGIPDNLSASERKEQKEREKKEYEKNVKNIPDHIKKKLNLPDKLDEQGVAEGDCEVEEDLDNKTIYPNARVIKTKKGRKVGEIYPLEYEDGSWGCFHYNADRGYEGMESEKEALEALKDMNEELSARGTRDMSEGIEKVDEDLSGMMRQGVKKVKRAIDWRGKNDPKSIRTAIRTATDKELRDSYSLMLLDLYDDPMPGDEEKWKGKPYGMAFKLMTQELKRRFPTTPKSNTMPDSVEAGLEKVDESYVVKKLKDPDTYAVFNKYVDKSRWFAASKGTKEEAEAFLAKLKAQHKDGDWRKAKTTFNEVAVLDANQKRVGQLGATEKVKNGARGKLAGVSEAVETKMSSADITKAKQVHKELKNADKLSPAYAEKIKAAHKMLRDKYGKDWRKLAGIQDVAESMAYGYSPEQSETTVNYSETKRTGDASVTISANAKSMAELHRVLKLAGIDVDVNNGPSATPEPEVTVMPAVSDQDSACGCGDQTDTDSDIMTPAAVSTRQNIIDRLRDTLKAKMAL